MAALQKRQTRSVDYIPRAQFQAFHDRDQRWAVIVAHRRCGKTVACVMELITRALATPKKDARYAYIAPFREQAKTVAWNYLKHYATSVVRDPETDFRESELAVRLFNGSVVRLFGADNPNALRGMYLDGVVLDEHADMRPNLWGEVIRPTLSDRNGWAVFIGTPRGKNEFWELYDRAGQSPDWFRLRLPASETGILAAQELADARRTMTQSQYEQEYECSFDAAIVGAIFANELHAARERIRAVPYDPSVLVQTAWDIGYGDATAIWFWQLSFGDLRIIDYYEAAGERLQFYLQMLGKKPYNYGTAYLPHDAENGSLTGLSVKELMDANSIRCEVLPRLSLEEGINAARMVIPICSFDSVKCAPGLEALRAYQWAYNQRMGETKPTPVHNWACLEGHTELLTRYGMRRIMDLPQLGEVMTQCGWQRYIHPHITRRDAPLVEVAFSDGSTTKCTPDHLFLTGTGWTYASDLQPNTLIQSFWTRSPSISMAAYFGCGLKSATTRAAESLYTALLGPPLSVRSPLAATSTIGTATQPTIASPTWNAYPLGSIFRSLGSRPRDEKKSISPIALGVKRRHGTNLRQGGYGTVVMRSGPSHGQNGSASRADARHAARRSIVLSARAAIRSAFAATTAKPLTIDNVRPLKQNADVWCLTVPSVGHFALANGAIVHNSHGADAFRYLAQAYRGQAGAPGAGGLKLPALNWKWRP